MSVVTDEMQVSFISWVWSSVGHSYNRHLITAECFPCWHTHPHTHVVCLWTCCIKVIIWTAQQEKRPWPPSLFLCLLPPGLSWLPPLPVSLCGSAQFNSGNGDGCGWREQVLNVRPKCNRCSSETKAAGHLQCYLTQPCWPINCIFILMVVSQTTQQLH